MSTATPPSGPSWTVQDFMTLDPLTITPSTTLADVAELMRTRAVRHVPVLDGAALVGVVSERDLHVARTLRSISMATAKAEIIMVGHPLAVEPGARLSDVAARMLDRKAGSAIVVHEGRVVGIFTTQDALMALHRILGSHTVG